MVGLPERLDRTLRLGPFPSGREALKFVSYAAVGASLVPFLGAVAWIPFLLWGGVAAIWHPDGEAIDDRLARFVRWRIRRFSRPNVTAAAKNGVRRRSILRLGTSYVGALRAGGIPLAYLPTAELAARFEGYRDLLRAYGGSFVLLSARAPIHAVPFLPAEPAPIGPEGAARAGYRELVEIIVRRRHLRQVYIALATPASGPEGIQRLETQIVDLSERLRGLGLRPVRLRDRALVEAAQRLGIVDGGVP